MKKLVAERLTEKIKRAEHIVAQLSGLNPLESYLPRAQDLTELLVENLHSAQTLYSLLRVEQEQPKKFTILPTVCAESIQEMAIEACTVANQMQHEVYFEFNGVSLRVKPADKMSIVVEQYYSKLERKG